MPSSRAASATVRHDVSPMASPRDRRSDSGASISSRFDPSNHDSAGRKPEQIRRGSGDRRTPDPARASAVKSPASSPSLGPSHFPPGLPVPPGAYPFPYLPYPMQPFMGYPYNIDRLLLEHQRDISRTHELRKSSAEAARKSPASEHSRSSSGDADRPRSRQSDQRSALSPMIRQNPHLTSMHGHPLALGFPPPPYNWGHGKCWLYNVLLHDFFLWFILFLCCSCTPSSLAATASKTVTSSQTSYELEWKLIIACSPCPSKWQYCLRSSWCNEALMNVLLLKSLYCWAIFYQFFVFLCTICTNTDF